MKLVESGLENDAVLALLVFSLQYILVNHEFGKYKGKHLRWKVTIKVQFELPQFHLFSFDSRVCRCFRNRVDSNLFVTDGW